MALPFVTERKAEKVVKEVIREGGITGGFSIPTIDLDKEEWHISDGEIADSDNLLRLKYNIELPIDLEKGPLIRFKFQVHFPSSPLTPVDGSTAPIIIEGEEFFGS